MSCRGVQLEGSLQGGVRESLATVTRLRCGRSASVGHAVAYGEVMAAVWWLVALDTNTSTVVCVNHDAPTHCQLKQERKGRHKA